MSADAGVEGGGERQPARLPLRAADAPQAPATTSGGGAGIHGADVIIESLRFSADQELTIAERLASKARQAFTLGAGVFVVAQTVAFGSFEEEKLTATKEHWIIGLAILAVVILSIAAGATLRADATAPSGDLPLDRVESDLNAAYEGDEDVVGRVAGYYLGIVRSRRSANAKRFEWYRVARYAVLLSLVSTAAELIFALLARAT